MRFVYMLLGYGQIAYMLFNTLNVFLHIALFISTRVY